MTEPIARIEAALTRLGSEHEPPPGWEARVLAATATQKRRPWWLFPLPVAMFAAIGAAAFLLWPRALVESITFDGGPGQVRSVTSRSVGDVAHLDARHGGSQRALWVHRDEQLVLACPGDAKCRGEAAADLRLDRVGRYTVTWWSSDADIPAPKGAYSADVAAAMNADAQSTRRDIDVR